MLVGVFAVLNEIFEDLMQMEQQNHSRPYKVDRDFTVANAGASLIGISAFEYGTDGQLCDPESWLQVHSLWHILAAYAQFNAVEYSYSEL